MQSLYGEVVLKTDPTVAASVSKLLQHVRSLHRALDAEHLAPGVEVLLSSDAGHEPSADGSRLLHLDSLRALLSPERAGIRIVVMRDSSYRFQELAVSEDAVPGFVKYVNRPFLAELILAGDERFDVAQIDGLISPFSISYFRDLEAALGDYYLQRARYSTCAYLEQAWGDTEQLVLANKPERFMRRSLHDYLSVRLRDAEPTVLQEQNVNETEPVDIRVQWLGVQRISLLEVKWLGASLADGEQRIATEYSAVRAREGYIQARDYLLEQRRTLPGHIVRSRLIVFDARRGGLSMDDRGQVSVTSSWSFKNKEIDYASVRDNDSGVDEPIRYFMEPKQVHAA